MQKLKYYTVVLTALFLSYPNITLSQTPTPNTQNEVYNNYERAKAVCERKRGIYDIKEGTEDNYECRVEPDYDEAAINEAAKECERFGGKDGCVIDLQIRIEGLGDKCRAAKGKWINDSFCSFDEVLKENCKTDGGEWKNRQCIISDKALFTHARREEILEDIKKPQQERRYDIKGLRKVIFYTEFNFEFQRDPTDAKKKDYSIQKGRYSIETQIEDTYSVQVGVPGICLHKSAQQRKEWTSSEGDCVDPEGTNVEEEDSIWIIFSKDEHGFIDNHGFKFIRGEEDYYYLDLKRDDNGHIWLYWSTRSGNQGKYQIIEYTMSDPENPESDKPLTNRLINDENGEIRPIEPGEVPVIRLRYDVDSLEPLKDVLLSDKRKRDLIGVAP